MPHPPPPSLSLVYFLVVSKRAHCSCVAGFKGAKYFPSLSSRLIKKSIQTTSLIRKLINTDTCMCARNICMHDHCSTASAPSLAVSFSKPRRPLMMTVIHTHAHTHPHIDRYCADTSSSRSGARCNSCAPSHKEPSSPAVVRERIPPDHFNNCSINLNLKHGRCPSMIKKCSLIIY